MKKINILLIICVLLSFAAIDGFASEKSVSSTQPVFQSGVYDPNGQIISVQAKGLVCDFCAKALEKVILKRGEVAALNIDLTTKEILINLKDGQSLDDATVEKLILDSGYNIEEIKRK